MITIQKHVALCICGHQFKQHHSQSNYVCATVNECDLTILENGLKKLLVLSMIWYLYSLRLFIMWVIVESCWDRIGEHGDCGADSGAMTGMAMLKSGNMQKGWSKFRWIIVSESLGIRHVQAAKNIGFKVLYR
jgi:hypothetical protein